MFTEQVRNDLRSMSFLPWKIDQCGEIRIERDGMEDEVCPVCAVANANLNPEESLFSLSYWSARSMIDGWTAEDALMVANAADEPDNENRQELMELLGMTP